MDRTESPQETYAHTPFRAIGSIVSGLLLWAFLAFEALASRTESTSILAGFALVLVFPGFALAVFGFDRGWRARANRESELIWRSLGLVGLWMNGLWLLVISLTFTLMQMAPELLMRILR